jgi:uncharacterized protein
MSANHARHGARIMSLEIAEAAVSEYARISDAGRGSGEGGECAEFLWHGGEPLLAGREFYRKVLDKQAKLFGRTERVGNALTTNGVLVDAEWAQLFREHRVGVTVSIDGPAELHDLQRPHRSGGGSLEGTLRGLETLRAAGLDPTVMMVVTEATASAAKKVYAFVRERGIRALSLVPQLSRTARVSPESYSRFMTEFFDMWLEQNDVEFQVRDFEVLIARLFGGDVPLCEYGDRCGGYPSVDVDGALYYCDFFAGRPEYRLGVLPGQSLSDMLTSEQSTRHRVSARQVPRLCNQCSMSSVCGRGCLFRRSLGTDGVDVWCDAKKRLIDHVTRALGARVVSGQRHSAS